MKTEEMKLTSSMLSTLRLLARCEDTNVKPPPLQNAYSPNTKHLNRSTLRALRDRCLVEKDAIRLTQAGRLALQAAS